MNADEAEAPDSTYQSAYTAPPYPRPQADRDHQQESLTLGIRERGDLTAHNLELIPDAEHVAPGIRLDRGGNDYPFRRRAEGDQRGDRVMQDSGVEHGRDRDVRVEGGVVLDKDMEAEDADTTGLHPRTSHANKRSSIGGQASSSIDATGRSSIGGQDVDMGDDTVEEEGHEMYEDVIEEDEDVFDEKNVNVLHERVGGSGATSENASKGTSVGHFGPRGEAIPGVPPHLDPRQPHFRPPSPGAASVLSVAVHPPASPKMHGISGSGANLSSLPNHDYTDSGEETESFDNGALTPTLSEEVDDDDGLDKIKLDQSRFDSSSGVASGSSQMNDEAHPFGFGRLQLGGGPQVSFSPNVLAHESDVVGLSRTTRAPSIAATAGSSRAPSARGLSPPVSLSRATTTEGSSLEEYGSIGTGMAGSGAETPSLVRSRRSSYSAPSSEVEPNTGMEVAEGASTRARGGTLVATAMRGEGGRGGTLGNGGGNGGGGSSVNLHDDEEMREGPSLAPSEAGSDSNRSMTQDSSSLGHGLAPSTSSAGLGAGILGSSDRSAGNLSSTFASAGTSSSMYPEAVAAVAVLNDPASSSKSSLHPVLPSLLAIKKAARRNGSGAASTAATAGTTSPSSNLSIDGDDDFASGGEQQ